MQHIRPNTTVIDVGANLGTHCIHMLKHMQQIGVESTGAHLVAIEPQPFIFEILSYNVSHVDAPNVKTSLIKGGLSEKHGSIYVDMPDYSTTKNPGGYGLGHDKKGGKYLQNVSRHIYA